MKDHLSLFNIYFGVTKKKLMRIRLSAGSENFVCQVGIQRGNPEEIADFT